MNCRVVKPSGAYYGSFTLSRFDTGAAANADSLPEALAIKNGVTDGAWTLTVTTPATGLYTVSGTVPGTYSAGDDVDIQISATVNSVSAKAIVDKLKVIAEIPYDSLILGTDYLPIDLIQANGVAQAFPANFSLLVISVTGAAAANTLTLANGSIIAATFAAGAINNAALATGAISNVKIAASSIGASQIQAEAITSAKFAANAITSTVIASGALTSAKFNPTYATVAGQTSILNSLTNITNYIGAFTGTGVNTILGFFRALLSKAAAVPSDVGGTFDPITDSTEAIADAALTSSNIDARLSAYHAATKSELDAAITEIKGPGWETPNDTLHNIASQSGMGAYTITLTVNDGTNLVENATVRLTSGVLSYTANTNVSGVASFSLDGATYSVAITKSGYAFTPTTLVISADTTYTYSMSATIIPASDPTFVTGYLYCYDETGIVEAGVTVELALYTATGSGIGFNTQTRSSVSNSQGLVSFTNLLPGAAYMVRRGYHKVWNPTTGEYFNLHSSTALRWKKFTVPVAATDPYAMPVVWGEET